MNNNKMINEQDLEKIAGGYNIETVSLQRGDKFLVDGCYRYVGENYNSIPVRDYIVFYIREDPSTGEAVRANGTALPFTRGTYLGSDVAGLERLLLIAK